ncbi:ABC transporter ATP-binding protein [Kitasatospora sp. RB6PN24]|uniref:ABC transporter ATP-binding protein n=1 Tax=Kitasatospora humi TaxID=2893891 RepID=UPI001E43E685|nr:ABC transporter ATP-binding protein [Kitasatospora humi]MCC9309532.1 ABC transporter ATP-binding protein [Kitasatospora humi]
MPNSNAPVVLSDLSKSFGSTRAVSSVTWSPKPGRVTALVGLNGAGKSTLMRLVTGLMRPGQGAVRIATGSDRRPLSAMIEAPALHTALTVRRNLRVHALLTGATAAETAEAAELAQVTHVLDRRVGTLSQGYRQRTAMALALLRRPEVLLLDEPTNALDPQAIAVLRTMIREVADQGCAVVVSTHQLRELDGVADDLTLLHSGQVLYDGPFDAFVGPAGLRIRAADQAATTRLAALMRADGLAAEQAPDGIRTPPNGRGADATAQHVFATAARAGIELVELSHLTPTLEEAFHSVISGARS